ncbi:hypothetical protein LXL04_022047 [Taraxacum kok-saghyz]
MTTSGLFKKGLHPPINRLCPSLSITIRSSPITTHQFKIYQRCTFLQCTGPAMAQNRPRTIPTSDPTNPFSTGVLFFHRTLLDFLRPLFFPLSAFDRLDLPASNSTIRPVRQEPVAPL